MMGWSCYRKAGHRWRVANPTSLENPTKRGELRQPGDSQRSVLIGREVGRWSQQCDETKKEIAAGPPEPFRRAKHIEARANGALIRRTGARSCGTDLMREPLPELGGEDKARIRATRSIHCAAWSGLSG